MHSRRVCGTRLDLDCADEPGTGFGRSAGEASEGTIVDRGIVGQTVCSGAAHARTGAVCRTAANRPLPAGAKSENAHVLRAWGKANGALGRRGPDRLFVEPTTEAEPSGPGRQDPLDQRLPAFAGGDGGTVYAALANRAVLQGIEKHARLPPVPVPLVRQSG